MKLLTIVALSTLLASCATMEKALEEHEAMLQAERDRNEQFYKAAEEICDGNCGSRTVRITTRTNGTGGSVFSTTTVTIP